MGPPLALLALLAGGGCKSVDVAEVLQVSREEKGDYQLDDKGRRDLGGKTRLFVRITVPKGQSQEQLERNIRRAALEGWESSVVPLGAVLVHAYAEGEDHGEYSAAKAVFAPKGDYDTPDPRLPLEQWQVKVEVRDTYLSGEFPKPEPKKPAKPPKDLGWVPSAVATAGDALRKPEPAPAPADAAAGAGAGGGVAAADAGTPMVAVKEPRYGTLTVLCKDEKGKEISHPIRVSGEFVGETPWTGRLPAGLHQIALKRMAIHSVVVKADKHVTKVLPYVKYEPPPPPGMGTLSKAAIRKTIDKNRGGVRSCYEKELKKDRFLEGKVAIQFEIDVDGKVKTAKLLKSTLDNRSAEKCIVSRIKGLRFPKPEGGTVFVAHPFDFKPRR